MTYPSQAQMVDLESQIGKNPIPSLDLLNRVHENRNPFVLGVCLGIVKFIYWSKEQVVFNHRAAMPS